LHDETADGLGRIEARIGIRESLMQTGGKHQRLFFFSFFALVAATPTTDHRPPEIMMRLLRQG
jgi:hypothetical protein